MSFNTPEELRSFLKHCLDPGEGRSKRTPAQLIAVLPDPWHDDLITHAPHLHALRHRMDVRGEQQKAAHEEYADAVAAWINETDEPGSSAAADWLTVTGLDAAIDAFASVVTHMDVCRLCTFDADSYTLCAEGRSLTDAALAAAANATGTPAAPAPCLHENTADIETVGGRVIIRMCDDCGHRLDVAAFPANPANASHAAHVAARLDGETPDGARSLPILDTFLIAYDAAMIHIGEFSTVWSKLAAHIDRCDECRPDMLRSELCHRGQWLTVAALDAMPDLAAWIAPLPAGQAIDTGDECAHAAWEVTREEPFDGQWQKHRKCADCGTELVPVIEPEPHKGPRKRHSRGIGPAASDQAVNGPETAAEAASPADGPEVVAFVAFRIEARPGVLWCREHGEGWPGLTPLTSEDLPNGGICTWRVNGADECGRDVLAPIAKPAPMPEACRFLGCSRGLNWHSPDCTTPERLLTDDNIANVDDWLDRAGVFAKPYTRPVDGRLDTVGLRIGSNADKVVAYFGDTIVRHPDGTHTVRRAQVEDPHDGPLATRYETSHDMPARCQCRTDKDGDSTGWIRYRGRDGEFVTLPCRDHNTAGQ